MLSDRVDIAGWCDLPGALVSWNIFRKGFGEEEDHAPDMVLDHSRFGKADMGKDESNIICPAPLPNIATVQATRSSRACKLCLHAQQLSTKLPQTT